MQEAMQKVVDDIKVKQAPIVFKFKKTRSKVANNVIKFYVNEEDKNVSFIAEENFWIQDPVDPQTYKLPRGTVEVRYNPDDRSVTYYNKDGIVVAVNRPQVNKDLPIPSYFSELESVEEILDLDLETAEVVTILKFDVLDEQTHWLLRLQEFKRLTVDAGKMSEAKFQVVAGAIIKNLKELRGCDLLDPNFKISKNVLDAIKYAEKQKFMRG